MFVISILNAKIKYQFIPVASLVSRLFIWDVVDVRFPTCFPNFETPKIKILYPQNILLQKVIGNILFWRLWDIRIGYNIL
jgi:hypothetical protein